MGTGHTPWRPIGDGDALGYTFLAVCALALIVALVTEWIF